MFLFLVFFVDLLAACCLGRFFFFLLVGVACVRDVFLGDFYTHLDSLLFGVFFFVLYGVLGAARYIDIG
jgi:hypothetical protein